MAEISHSYEVVTKSAARLVEAVTELQGDSATSITVAATVRAAVKAALHRAKLPKGARSAYDLRVRRWHCKVNYVVLDSGGSPSTHLSGEAWCAGLAGVAEWLRDGAVHLFGRDQLPAECTAHNIYESLHYLRSSLSRRDGRANMRYKITWPDGRPGFIMATVTTEKRHAEIETLEKQYR
jgi:hypothetical protein